MYDSDLMCPYCQKWQYRHKTDEAESGKHPWMCQFCGREFVYQVKVKREYISYPKGENTK